jgi:predicted  nucleic acid-binding Zn-ribbon protein
MAKNKKTPVAPVTVSPLDELNALKVQRDAVEGQIKELHTNYRTLQVSKKDLQDKIRALSSSIVEARINSKVEKTNAKIQALQAKLNSLSGVQA